MKPQAITEITLEELKTLIRDIVDEKLSQLPQQSVKSLDRQQLQEIFTAIDSHIWTPPPQAPSTLELLREDRYE